MKKFGLFIISLIAATLLFCAKNVRADEFLHIKSTSYCYNSGKTASGTVPEEGRTLAGCPEWYGMTVVMWEDKGSGIQPENYIGTFICEDTGGEPIKKGYVVDVYIRDYERAVQYGSKDVIIQLIDAEG